MSLPVLMMGSSQSKRHRNSRGYAIDQRRRLEHDSIVAAIASNRRQRKLLLKQMARQREREALSSAQQQHHHLSESVLYNDQQVCYASGCQSSLNDIYAAGTANVQLENSSDFSNENHPIHHHYQQQQQQQRRQQQNRIHRRSSISLDNSVVVNRRLFGKLTGKTAAATTLNNHPIYLPPTPARDLNNVNTKQRRRKRQQQHQNQHHRLANHLTQPPIRQDEAAHATTIYNYHHEEKSSVRRREKHSESATSLAASLAKGLTLREQRELHNGTEQRQDLQRQQHWLTRPSSQLARQQQQQQRELRLQTPQQQQIYKTTATLQQVAAQGSTSSQYSSQSHHSSSSLDIIDDHYNDDDDDEDEVTHHYSSPEQLNRGRNHQHHLLTSPAVKTSTTMATSTTTTLTADAQRSLAFTDSERRALRLEGLLPAAHQDQELQVGQVMNFIDKCQDELSKYVYLRNLKDFNERLFYSALTSNVEKLMPLVYTPTVGLACQRFSEIYLRPRGLYLNLKDGRAPVAQVLANWPMRDVRVIVVTDGERILGLGDLGANGMGISIGKLSLYTALAGIPPANVLPICLDVGTQNKTNLEDPYYIGLRHERVRGEKYYNFIEEFMQAVVDRWGRSCLIQFEDFANATAFNLLQKYRDTYCTFNDDIQGTASVCLSGLISATKLIGRRLSNCSFLFYGAGEANLGTAHLLVMAMLEEGDENIEEARKRIYLIDSKGLVVAERTDLSEHKRQFAQKSAPYLKDLEQIIDYVKPTAIIGASAQGGAFNESICRKMASFNEKPIIFALSNPTSKAECTAQQAYTWTEGRCVFASGSPFEPVEYKGKTYVTGQGNNAYIFPGVGLAAIAAHVHTIPEDTFLVAARALSDQLTEQDTQVGLIYPSLTKIRQVTLRVASRVLEHFYTERLATYRPEPDDKTAFLKSIQYDCRYDAAAPLDLSGDSQTLHQMSLAEQK